MTRSTVLLAALGIVLLGALWWLFLYSPGRDDLARLQEEIAAAETEQASLTARVAGLEAIRERAPETEAAIARLRSIVPDDPDLPGALRQIAAAAEDAGVDIESLATTRPDEVDPTTGLYASQITLTTQGSYFQLVDFLRRLEDPAITARGILMQNMTVSSAEYPTLTAGLQAQMFSVLAPPPSPDDPDTTVPPPDQTEGTEAGADTQEAGA